MWGVLRRLAVGAALCCALAAVPCARAAFGGIPSSESFTFTGSLTYSWHGDPARGCAREGLCSVVGSITFRSDGGTQGFGGVARTLDVDAMGTSTVRVHRAGLGTAPSGSGDCVEIDRSDVGLRLPAGSSGTASSRASLSSGRCAGPTASDLSRVGLPARINGRRVVTADFSGRRAFVAGPFIGELVSTLALRPAGGSETSTGGSSTGSSGPPIRKRIVEFVDLRYRVSILPSALVTSFTGTSPPSCELLDSCGLTGSVTASTEARAGTLGLEGVRVVHGRVGRARVLADLLAGRVPLFESRPPFTAVPLRVSEMTERAGVADCADAGTFTAAAFQGPTLSFDQHAPGTMTAGLVAPQVDPGSSGIDALRTHCPGPASADIVGAPTGSQGYIVRDVVPLRRFLDRRLAMSLVSAGSFHSAGYSGSRRGSVVLSLSLLSVRTGTRREAA